MSKYIILFIVLILVSQAVWPDFKGVPFALRPNAAFDHLSSYADIRGYANASAASPFGSS